MLSYLAMAFWMRMKMKTNRMKTNCKPMILTPTMQLMMNKRKRKSKGSWGPESWLGVEQTPAPWPIQLQIEDRA